MYRPPELLSVAYTVHTLKIKKVRFVNHLDTRVLFGQPGRRCSVPIDRFSTPTGGSSAGGMVPQGVSKYCNFNEDFRYVFKSAVGAVVYELR